MLGIGKIVGTKGGVYVALLVFLIVIYKTIQSGNYSSLMSIMKDTIWFVSGDDKYTAGWLLNLAEWYRFWQIMIFTRTMKHLWLPHSGKTSCICL